MTSRYNEAMEHIVVTDEARSRILAEVSELDHSTKPYKVVHLPRRWIAWAACLTLLAVSGAILPNHCPAPTPPEVERPIVGAVNPNSVAPNAVVPGTVLDVVAVDSKDALEQAVGFPVESLPLESVKVIAYRVYQKTVAEVFYTTQEGNYVLRKSTGSEDNSGRADAYDRSVQMETAGLEVTLKGDDNGCYLALWSDGSYAWSLGLPKQNSWDDALDLVTRIMSGHD